MDDPVPFGRAAPALTGEDGGRQPARPSRRIQVLLAEDHPLMRSSLCGLLEAESDIEVSATADTLEQLGTVVAERAPDVLVLDLSMAEGPAADLLRLLRTRVGPTPIVALSMENSRAFAQGALAAGASAHVLKELADVELPAAIRRAVGRAPYAPSGRPQPAGAS